jgi:hypothetical protein
MKLFIISILAALYCLPAAAQADTALAPAATDSIPAKNTLTLGVSYSNNANYYGQKAATKAPYAAFAATYKLKCGIYFSGLAYKLLNDTGAIVSASSAGAGIAFNMGKHFSADINYSHTFYPAYSPLLQASNADNGSATLVYDNWLNTKLTIDYAFGKTQDLFGTFGTGKQITLGSISKKDIVTITPSVDVVAGTQRFYQSYLTEKRLRDSLLGTVTGPILGQPGGQETSTKTMASTRFTVLSYNFKCPLAYNRAHYLVEIAYQLSVLSNKAQSNAGQANSFLSASFYYQF